MPFTSFLRIFAVAAFVCALAPSVWAESISKEQGDAILNELRQIRQLLQRPQPAAQPMPSAQPAVRKPDERATVSIAGAPILGKVNAPLTLVLFTDYQCSFCSRFEAQTLPEIKSQYINTGKLRFIVRDLPLSFHPHAAKAAEATHCAAEQSKFWEFRDMLTANKDNLEEKFLHEYARQTGLDVEKFTACLDSGRNGDKVKNSVSDANAQNISGTPTFVLGRTNGDTVEGVKLMGALPFDTFNQKLKDLLRDVENTKLPI